MLISGLLEFFVVDLGYKHGTDRQTDIQTERQTVTTHNVGF